MTLQTPWLIRQLKRLHRDYQSQAGVNPAADAFWEGYNLALLQVQRAVEAKVRRDLRHAEIAARGAGRAGMEVGGRHEL